MPCRDRAPESQWMVSTICNRLSFTRFKRQLMDVDKCPLWVKSRDSYIENIACPLYPLKRIMLSGRSMSAKCQ